MNLSGYKDLFGGGDEEKEEEEEEEYSTDDEEEEGRGRKKEEEDEDEEDDEEEEEAEEAEDQEDVGDNSLEGREDDLDDDEDEEDDENIYQKLSEPKIMQSLEMIHPEIKSCNYEEIVALSRIVRNVKGQIIDPLHTTIPFLTKYEKARIIGARAEQIDRGGPVFVEVDPRIIHGRTIAMMEFEQKKIPFIIARPLPNQGIEYWRVEDLEIL